MQIRKLSPATISEGVSNYAILAVLIALAAQAPVAGAAIEEEREGQANTEFVRIRHDKNHQPLSLETAIVRYRGKAPNGNPVIVDLIGVVHIGEKNYYETLNSKFKNYDALLYELVAPEGTKVPVGGRKDSGTDPLSGLQTGMKDMLGLEFQLDHINYHQDNFVHADMSPEEFLESMSKNDESFAKMFFKMLGSSLAAQGSGATMDEADFLMAMFAKDRKIKMRQMMAKQLSSMELGMIAFEGADGSTIINHRNGKCFEVLDREIAAGKKTVGVFFGAGHLPDMEQRLLDKGFQREGKPQWFVAWPLTRKSLETVVPEDAEAGEPPAKDDRKVSASETEVSPSDEMPPQLASSESQEGSAGSSDATSSESTTAACPSSPTRRGGRLFRWRR